MIHGIDIGGTKIELTTFDDALLPMRRVRAATPADDYDRFLEAVVHLIDEADEIFQGRYPVGIGFPGLMRVDGRAFASNLPGVSGRQIALDLAALLKHKVAIAKDALCFTLSEACGGAGQGHRGVFGMVLGTGIGGGMIVDGKPVEGRSGIAGECGHWQLPAPAQAQWGLPLWPCGCGFPACFESYISGRNLPRLARHFGLECRTSREFEEARLRGNPKALRAFDCFIDLLGRAVAIAVLSYDPDIVVLGGGVSLMDDLTARLPAAVERHIFPNFPPPAIALATFGDSSGTRGAAILARERALRGIS